MSSEVVKSYLPFPWISMAQTKHYFYKGLAHFYVAMALLGQKGEVLCGRKRSALVLWSVLPFL